MFSSQLAPTFYGQRSLKKMERVTTTFEGRVSKPPGFAPIARINFSEQYETSTFSLLPTVYVGWIGYYPLRANNIIAGLFNLDNNTNLFTINSNPADHWYINQFTTGFSFTVVKSEEFVIEISSNVALFNDLTNINTSIRGQFSF